MSSKPFSSISRCSTPATLSPFSKLPFPQTRSFSSPSGSSNIVPIKSENEFNASLTKVQDESLPAIFYFTAVWCGPCRFISPVIGELSEQYPHVKTYKIDIDEEGLGSVLSKLNISAVPTLHFFKNGEKADEVIGADIARLKNTVEKLYKQDWVKILEGGIDGRQRWLRWLSKVEKKIQEMEFADYCICLMQLGRKLHCISGFIELLGKEKI